MLAENSRELESPYENNLLDERILELSSDKWTMYFDGVVNLSGSGIGAVLISPAGQHYPVAAKLVFPCTNNISKYEACILGLLLAIDMKVRKLQVYGDSALIILQTEGLWRTRDSKFIPYHGFLEELLKEFEEISFEYLPRSQNQFADALATLSSMLQVMKGLDTELLRIEILERPAYCMTIANEPDGKPWYYDIMIYLQKGEFPRGSEMKQVAKSFNRKVQPRHFEVDDLVLKKILSDVPEPREKFTPNYEGPYVVKKVLPGGALVLIEIDGRELPKPVNADAVKKYFP
ncbi:uncharacterized protein LOC130140478 [Syzygium oleosum]|uniref:uncharacterized protein LOC130140478 n=1 Tax=Syzygium oleosum TaxID=219896 RepID=UPI0024BAA5EE|nr:uncharacterized protein LOC130140478 [Syzygium oleosum]